jgi:Flp pilus assembly protein CpaB
MRPSTIFILTVALLLGVAAAIAGRMTGLFGRLEEASTKKQETLILVAGKPLFTGDVINPANVRTRALRPDESAEYERRKDQYLPAVTQAVALRVAKKNIEADAPILKEHLEDLSKPDPLAERILPQMRAVNLSLNKEHSAGGLIQPGDWVDVMLTSNIEMPDGTKLTRTAVIANNVRVIAKRNTLYNVFEPLPEDKPVQFLLEANPYRAALIEDGKKKGQLTITPLPAVEQQRLEKQRTQAFEQAANISLVSFADPQHPEMTEEQQRVEAYTRGTLVVGDADFARIFGIKAVDSVPVPANIVIERVMGNERRNASEFNALTGQEIVKDAGQRATPAKATSNKPRSVQFQAPDAGRAVASRTARRG